MKTKISVFIITYNEEKIIEKCVSKLTWADEIIVVDSKSTDNTVAICEKYKAKVFLKDFENYGKQKQFALNQTKNNWVLSLDADEILSDELISEIKSLDLNNNNIYGYLIPRTHVFLNKVFRFGSENKKPILRFFDKTKGSFLENKVHEKIVVEGKLGKLNNEMLHFTVFDFGKNKKVSIFKVSIKFPFEFIRVYFFQRNFLNGYQGFIWSMLAAYSSFIKYAQLFDLNHNKPR